MHMPLVVTKRCFFLQKTGNAKKVGIVLENGKAHEWTEEELKKVQAQLMKNQANQGTQTEIVKNEALNRFKAGLSHLY